MSDIAEKIECCFQDPEIRERSFYPEFRRAWHHLIKDCEKSDTVYFDINEDKCYTLHNVFMGVETDFHIDQLKIADWYIKEVKSKKNVVFFGKKLKRDRKTGELMFHDAVCSYNPEAPESALTDDIRNIVACGLPQLPHKMEVIYGNKWVNSRFNILRRNSLDFFLVGTDWVPAFLATPLEIALYLFFMDCCIIKTDVGKLPDDELRKYLHIFRPSPMLKIKGLVK